MIGDGGTQLLSALDNGPYPELIEDRLQRRRQIVVGGFLHHQLHTQALLVVPVEEAHVVVDDPRVRPVMLVP